MKQFCCAAALLFAFVTLALVFSFVRFSIADTQVPVSITEREDGCVRVSISKSMSETARSVLTGTWESLRALPFCARDTAEFFYGEAKKTLSLFHVLTGEGFGNDVSEI